MKPASQWGIAPKTNLSMRNKARLLLLLAIFLECVLLFVAFSPASDQDRVPTMESTRWREDPTPEEERTMRRLELWHEWKPRLVSTLLVVNGFFIFGYSALRIAKTTRPD
jgi:hypothetical protein